MIPMHVFDQALADHQSWVARVNREAWKRPPTVRSTPSPGVTLHREAVALITLLSIFCRWVRHPHAALLEPGSR